CLALAAGDWHPACHSRTGSPTGSALFCPGAPGCPRSLSGRPVVDVAPVARTGVLWGSRGNALALCGKPPGSARPLGRRHFTPLPCWLSPPSLAPGPDRWDPRSGGGSSLGGQLVVRSAGLAKPQQPPPAPCRRRLLPELCRRAAPRGPAVQP